MKKNRSYSLTLILIRMDASEIACVFVYERSVKNEAYVKNMFL